LQTICLGWFQTSILLIAASWVAKVIGVSHPQPASYLLFKESPRIYISYPLKVILTLSDKDPNFTVQKLRLRPVK
jgi:hypothetical protein